VIRVLVRACGRSDDGRDAVLRQDVLAGSCFRWPDPDEQFFTRATGLLTIRPGTGFSVVVADGLVFLHSAELARELCLHFHLLPVLPARVDLEIELLPSEVDEGTEFSSPPRPLDSPQPEVTPQ